VVIKVEFYCCCNNKSHCTSQLFTLPTAETDSNNCTQFLCKKECTDRDDCFRSYIRGENCCIDHKKVYIENKYCEMLGFNLVVLIFIIQWVPINWDISGVEYFFPVTQLPQLYGVAHKELKRYMYRSKR
jgi:hypothetical protein